MSLGDSDKCSPRMRGGSQGFSSPFKSFGVFIILALRLMPSAPTPCGHLAFVGAEDAPSLLPGSTEEHQQHKNQKGKDHCLASLPLSSITASSTATAVSISQAENLFPATDSAAESTIRFTEPSFFAAVINLR